MIRVHGRDSQADPATLPGSRAGLSRLLVLLFVAGLIGGVLTGAYVSATLVLDWVGARVAAGVFADWAAPLTAVFYFLVAVGLVLGVLLTIAEAAGVSRRKAAALARVAFATWDRCRASIQDTMPPDENPVGYLAIDHPDLEAPVLFERVYLVLLVLGHLLAFAAIARIGRVDGFVAATLWSRYGLAVALMNIVAVLAIPTSRAFALAVFEVAAATQLLLYVTDPGLTGPALRLPPGALAAVLVLLPLGALVLRWRKAGFEHLLVATSRGLRRVELSGDAVRRVEKTDAPLVLLATPIAAGVRFQVAGAAGTEKLPAMRAAGDGVARDVARVLDTYDLDARVQGADEPSGIAGRLGEVPLLGFVLLLSIVFLTQRTLLPPVTNWFRVRTVFGAYHAEWLAEGITTKLAFGLDKILRADPDLGQAQLTRAEIYADEGEIDKARFLVARLIRKRRAWADSRLVKRARDLAARLDREEMRPAAASPGGRRVRRPAAATPSAAPR